MKNRKLVCGVGVNDADYAITKWETLGYVNGKPKQKLVWICPFYRTWNNMLMRCYSVKYQERCPTYKGCSVSDEWLTFSVFKMWMEKQDFKGMHLDKDILFGGNKIYSPETCVFVTPMVNSFTTDSGASRGDCLIGVHRDKRMNKFKASCCNPFSGDQEHLGYFTCEQEAHNTWLKRKLELAYELAAEQTDERVTEALINRYSKYKTIKQNK